METSLSTLEKIAHYHYWAFHNAVDKVRDIYPCEDSERWDWDEETGTFRKIKLPSLEWLPFEEANEPF